MKLRDYQEEIRDKAIDVLDKYGLVYLAMEVRTGKTLTSLSICEKLNADSVLFVTKKKAIPSIMDDFEKLNWCTNFWCINYESLHKLPDVKWDIIICDEAHTLGAFPKPSKRAKQIREAIKGSKSRLILLSGTPTPESFSQMYHQVYSHPNNPFKEYANFYKFAKEHVRVTQRKINSNYINDYSKGLESINQWMKPYMLSYSQKEAGFKSTIVEKIIRVKMAPYTYIIADKLAKDLVVQGDTEVILADTPVKLMSKLHQIYSGTVKFESGNSVVLDPTKAETIKKRFKGKKIGIFYKFKAELEVLKNVFGDDLVTDLPSFDDSEGKVIALQIVSGREGISLRQAEAIVYYNIDFSATSYWQSRDRMTTKDRLKSDVYWVFSEGGIEEKIYDVVLDKKDYTLNHFKKDLFSA